MCSKFAAVLAFLACSSGFGVEVELVTIGSPRNAPDHTDIFLGPREVGQVEYTYRIGKFEITNGQYIEFLNAVAKTETYGLFHDVKFHNGHGPGGISRFGDEGNYQYALTDNDSNWAIRPVGGIDLFQAMRFANWMHNGQPRGPQDESSTEDGAYTLRGITELELDDEFAIVRNSDAKWAIPSENEWYKAAFYDSKNMQYYEYATGTDDIPSNVVEVNFNAFDESFTEGSPYWVSEIGSFNTPSPFGTFDQSGNLTEWTETHASGQNVILRGGSFYDGISKIGKSEFETEPAYKNDLNDGFATFRLVYVPEPAFGIIFFSVAPLFLLRKAIKGPGAA